MVQAKNVCNCQKMPVAQKIITMYRHLGKVYTHNACMGALDVLGFKLRVLETLFSTLRDVRWMAVSVMTVVWTWFGC